MTYDLINDIENWKPLGEFVWRRNPNRSWFEFWKPKFLKMEILSKFEDGETFYVAYYNDGSHVIAESIEPSACPPY